MKLIATIALAVCLALPALARQINCGPRADMVHGLETKYSERMVAAGMQKFGDTLVVMEIWTSPKTGTFTVLHTSSTGISCVVAAGTDFDTVASPVSGGPTRDSAEGRVRRDHDLNFWGKP